MDAIGLDDGTDCRLPGPGRGDSMYGLPGCMKFFAMREIGPNLLIPGPSWGTNSSSDNREFGLKTKKRKKYLID